MDASTLCKVAARVARGVDQMLLRRLAETIDQGNTETWLRKLSRKSLGKLQELVMDMDDEMDNAGCLTEIEQTITDEVMSRD